MEGPDPHKPCQWRAVNQSAATGRTHHLAVIGMMGETRSVVMRSTLTRVLISDQTSAADTGAGGRCRGGVK